MTHFLKLVDKMCKYNRDSDSIVEDTEIQFCPQTQTGRQMEKHTHKVKPVYSPSSPLKWGYHND